MVLPVLLAARQGRVIATPSRSWMDGSMAATDSLYLLTEEAIQMVSASNGTELLPGKFEGGGRGWKTHTHPSNHALRRGG